MKRVALIGLFGLFLSGAVGCGGPDGLMRELIVNLNAYAETVEKKEPADRQLAARDRVRSTVAKFDKLNMSADDQKKLLKKYEAELKKALERIQAAHKNQVMEGGTIPPDVLDGFFK